MSPWAKLAIAIMAEVAATIALRQSGGFTNPWWMAVMVLGYAASFWLLSQITSELEIGTIYAVWSAAGTAIVAAIGVAVFDEKLTALKVGGLALIILGVVALNLGGASDGEATAADAPPPGAAVDR